MSATRSRVSSLLPCCGYKVLLGSQKIWGRITSTFADKTREFRRKTIHTPFFPTSLKYYQPCSNATEQQWLPPGFMIRTALWSISWSACVFCIFEGKAGWSNKEFTQAVYSGVVKPLEKIFARCGLSWKIGSDETLSISYVLSELSGHSRADPRIRQCDETRNGEACRVTNGSTIQSLVRQAPF